MMAYQVVNVHTLKSNIHNFGLLQACHKILGLVRELNPGPPAPEARIIPLDQRASSRLLISQYLEIHLLVIR